MEAPKPEVGDIGETSPASPAPNTYQMKPHLDEKFQTVQVKEIIQVVLNETLTGWLDEALWPNCKLNHNNVIVDFFEFLF